MTPPDTLADLDALADVKRRLVELSRRYAELWRRVWAHAALAGAMPPLAWSAVEDQLRAEIREWRRDAEAVQAIGRPIEARVLGRLPSLCGDCSRRVGIGGWRRPVAGGPCPGCGRGGVL